MQNPFAKRVVKTRAEKDALLCEARADFRKCGPMNFLIAGTEEDFVDAVADNIEVEEENNFAPPALLSTTEQADFEIRLTQNTTFDRIFANRRTDTGALPPVLQKFADEQEAAELEAFLAPARRADNALNYVIQKAVEEVISKMRRDSFDSRVKIPMRPIPERKALMPLLTNTVDEDSDTDAATYVRAFVSGDNEGMRAIARKIAAA